jgi:hypothetical protein
VNDPLKDVNLRAYIAIVLALLALIFLLNSAHRRRTTRVMRYTSACNDLQTNVTRSM